MSFVNGDRLNRDGERIPRRLLVRSKNPAHRGRSEAEIPPSVLGEGSIRRVGFDRTGPHKAFSAA